MGGEGRVPPIFLVSKSYFIYFLERHAKIQNRRQTPSGRKSKWKERKKKKNIAFTRGGAHLPIAHALRLLSTQELRFGLTKFNLRKKKNRKNLARGFLFLDEIEIEKK